MTRSSIELIHPPDGRTSTTPTRLRERELSDAARTLLTAGAASSSPSGVAPPEISRDPRLALARDASGEVGIRSEDMHHGLAVIGGPKTGKTSLLCQTVRADASDRGCAVVVVTARREDALKALSSVPPDRRAHFLDLSDPELGFNPLSDEDDPELIADDIGKTLGAVQRDAGNAHRGAQHYVKQATRAVICAGRNGAVEGTPTFWHVYRTLLPGETRFRQSLAASGVSHVLVDTATSLDHELCEESTGASSGRTAAVESARQSLLELMVARVDRVLRHPVQISLRRIVHGAEVLIVVAGNDHRGTDGESLLLALLLSGLRRAAARQSDEPDSQPPRVAMKIDDAHVILSERLARVTKRLGSDGVEVVAVWPHGRLTRADASAQILRSQLEQQCVLPVGVGDEETKTHTATSSRGSAATHTGLSKHEALCSWISRGARVREFTAQLIPPRIDETLLERHLGVQRAHAGRVADQLADPLADLGEQQRTQVYAQIAAAEQAAAARRTATARQLRARHQVTRGAGAATDAATAALQTTSAACAGEARTEQRGASKVGRDARRHASAPTTTTRQRWSGREGRRSNGSRARATGTSVRTHARAITLPGSIPGADEDSGLDEHESTLPLDIQGIASAETDPRRVAQDSDRRAVPLTHRPGPPRLREREPDSTPARTRTAARAHGYGFQALLAFVGITVVVVLVLTVTVLAGIVAYEKSVGVAPDAIGATARAAFAPWVGVANGASGEEPLGPSQEVPSGTSQGEPVGPSGEVPGGTSPGDVGPFQPGPLDPEYEWPDFVPAGWGAGVLLSMNLPGGVPTSVPFAEDFLEAQQVFDVNAYLLASVAYQESRFSLSDGLNGSGCAGLMQLGMNGACGDSWDSVVPLGYSVVLFGNGKRSHQFAVRVRDAYHYGTRPPDQGPAPYGPSGPPSAIHHLNAAIPVSNDPYTAIMAAAVFLRGKVGGQAIPSLDGTAVAALCGYYGACADAKANYAQTVLARAQLWQSKRLLGVGGGSAESLPSAVDLSASVVPVDRQQLGRDLSKVSAAELARVSAADLVSAVRSLTSPPRSPAPRSPASPAAPPATSLCNSNSPAGFVPCNELASAPSSRAAARAVNIALKQLGKPYVYAAGGPNTFDCSGLTQFAYGKAGIELPHNAQAQYNLEPPAPMPLQAGDLVFFAPSKTRRDVGHVGIYLGPATGGGWMIDAPHTGAVVRFDWFPTTIGQSWGGDVYVGATRPAPTPLVGTA